ncbi:cell surface receptor IPT/TIG domain-containing protein [Fibrisoma limi BUZ 3]|uniref:Cell surface receptor IPT/TIG domain-containing protein n=1 Tax=Fibrisoma limi BUZ 3 TaxID=1185876 RepID=I2GI87_9BACT|nr:IPT/TIG domain-containing protein [Fibrisoma limi]CCH53612.1 cell surface receptor IPT/TIG domain-containing protein [Fibrisoma limi BUZ 3]
MKSILLRYVSFFLLITISGCRIKNSPPELSNTLPPQGFIGQEITLTGYQFGPEPIVSFGHSGTFVTATITNSTEEAIKAIVPRMTTGRTQVRVVTAEGTSDPLPFLILQPAPTLTTVAPTNGLPGTSVVLKGDFLDQLKSVRFGQATAIIRDSTAQQVTVIVPNNVPRGPQLITVETQGGSLTGDFLVAGTPQITGISPKRARAGTELVIQGVNLLDGVVRINGQLTDRNQTRVQDTEIRTIIPAMSTSGPVSVTVFDRLTTISADSLYIAQAPVVTAISSAEGIRGDRLTLAGQNFRDVSSVLFGNIAASFQIISNTQIDVTVPAIAQSGEVIVSVSGIGGNANSPRSFLFYQAPSNITFSPPRQVRGQEVSVTGQNLFRITEARIGDRPAPISSRTEGSELRILVPNDAVSGTITVTNRAGANTSTRPLTVVQKPVVTDVTPRKGKPGDRVVLKGDFLLNAQIFFTGAATFAPDAGKNEDTERWITIPNDAQTGPIRITNASGQDTSTEPFTVQRPIANIDFTPKMGKAGSEIVITGQNLTTVTKVIFGNGLGELGTFVIDGNSLKVTVPAGVTTGSICLVNDLGTYCSTATFTVTK